MWLLQIMEKISKQCVLKVLYSSTVVPQASFPSWSKMEGVSGGAGGRGTEQGCHTIQGWCYSVVLTEWACLSDLRKGLDLGVEENVKPPQIFISGLGWSRGSRLSSSCITTSVLSVQGQLVVKCRTLRPSATWPQELNIWSEAAFWQDMGPQFLVLVLIVHVTAAMLIRAGWIWWERAEVRKCRRRNVLVFPLIISM